MIFKVAVLQMRSENRAVEENSKKFACIISGRDGIVIVIPICECNDGKSLG